MTWSYVLDEPTRILVVDDDPILREFASVHLSTPVASVETAADGGTALDLMLTKQFDIALVDISMPGLDGFELLQRVRARETLRHLPIVMLTGKEDIASIDRAYNLGAASFVTKPVNWRQLSYQLRYVIRASRMEAAVRDARAGAEGRAAARATALRLLKHEILMTFKSIFGLANLIAEDAQMQRPNPYANHATEIMTLGQGFLRTLQDLVEHSEANNDGAMPCEHNGQAQTTRDQQSARLETAASGG